MTKNYVGLTIHNVFEIEAETEDAAAEKVLALSLEDTLEHADYNIDYVEGVDQ